MIVKNHSVADTLSQLADKYQAAADVIRKSAEKVRELERDAQISAHDLSSVGSLGDTHSRPPVQQGFRERVIGLLRSNSGLKASEVVEQARTKGLAVSGKTSLERRIAGELSILKKNRVIRRDRWGRYRLREGNLN